MSNKSITTQEISWELLLDEHQEQLDLTSKRLRGLNYTFYSIPTVEEMQPCRIVSLGNSYLTIDEAYVMNEITKASPIATLVVEIERGRLMLVGQHYNRTIQGDWSKQKAGVDMAAEVGSFQGVTIHRTVETPVEPPVADRVYPSMGEAITWRDLATMHLFSLCTPARGNEITARPQNEVHSAT